MRQASFHISMKSQSLLIDICNIVYEIVIVQEVVSCIVIKQNVENPSTPSRLDDGVCCILSSDFRFLNSCTMSLYFVSLPNYTQ